MLPCTGNEPILAPICGAGGGRGYAAAVAEPPPAHELTGIIHCHSTYSDGTGTVPEIAAAARANDLDFLLLTDHDTLAAAQHGEEGWHGSVLLLVGL